MRKAGYWSLLFLVCAFGLHADPQITLLRKKINFVDHFEFDGPGKIFLCQGDSNILILEGTELALREIKIDNERGHLYLYHKTGMFHAKSPNIICRLIIRDLDKISLSGPCTLQSELLKCDTLTLELQDRAEAHVKIKADTVLSKILKSGKLTLEGEVEEQLVFLKGAGIYLADHLKNKETEIRILGPGKAQVQAGEELKVTIIGSGEVIYSGTPKVLNKNISGTGQIKATQP